MDNCGDGRPWTDSASYRAIKLARLLISGEMGLIEASRELSSLRYEFDAPLDELFMPFLVIDSETDSLPIGPVRREWNPAVLARIDVEISGYQESIRPFALEACRKLINALGAQSDQ
jgi:hypothetical protein